MRVHAKLLSDISTEFAAIPGVSAMPSLSATKKVNTSHQRNVEGPDSKDIQMSSTTRQTESPSG